MSIFEQIMRVCDRAAASAVSQCCGQLSIDDTDGESCFDHAFDFEITDGPILDAIGRAWKSGRASKKYIPREGRKHIMALLNLHTMAFDFDTQARLRSLIVEEVFEKESVAPNSVAHLQHSQH